MPKDTGGVLLKQLLDQDLSGVTFVRDYIQLQFNPPPQINVYGRCRLVGPEGAVAFGETEFANSIIAMIGVEVTAVDEVENQQIRISFANGKRIEISVEEGSFEGPEACEFDGKNGRWGVWP